MPACRTRALNRFGTSSVRGAFFSPLLPSKVLAGGIGSGKMRDNQVSRSKELDRQNRLPANFPTWRDMIAS
jgi:hypothetical protein